MTTVVVAAVLHTHQPEKIDNDCLQNDSCFFTQFPSPRAEIVLMLWERPAEEHKQCCWLLNRQAVLRLEVPGAEAPQQCFEVRHPIRHVSCECTSDSEHRTDVDHESSQCLEPTRSKSMSIRWTVKVPT